MAKKKPSKIAQDMTLGQGKGLRHGGKTMKLRTFDGEPVRGKMTTDPLVSPDGGPVLLVNDEPFSPMAGENYFRS
jgi:hypothetical protein